MAAGSSPSPQCLLALTILVLQCPERAIAFQAVPLSSLFINVIARVQNLFSLASNAFRNYEWSYISEAQRNTLINTACHTESLGTHGKDEAQRKTDGQLIWMAKVILQSWWVSLWSLQSMNTPVFHPSDRVFYKLQDLEEGVRIIMQQIGEYGPGSRPLMPEYDNFDPDTQNVEALAKNYGLLSCFKKDMHKVLTFMRVVKCRVLHEGNCPF